MRVSSILVGLIIFVCACDTENNFAIPDENYFVKFYGEEGDQEGIDFIVNTDGSVVMVGNTSRPGVLQQIYVVKVDANGQVLWQRRIGLGDKKDIAKDVELHPDGRIVIAGETEMSVGDRDFYVKILDQNGLELDSARQPLKLGVVTDEKVYSVSIINNGFMIAGSTTLLESGAPSPNDLRDAMHLRFDNSLNKIDESTGLWSEVTGTSNSDEYAAKIVEVDPNNLYFVFGSSNEDKGDNTTDYDFWIFGLGSTGGPYPGPDPPQLAGEPLFFGDPNDDELMTSVESGSPQSVSTYVMSGISVRSSGFSQTYVVQLTKAISLGRMNKLIESKPTDIGTNVSGIVRIVARMDNSYLLISDNFLLPSSSAGSNISLQMLNSEFSDNSKDPIIFGGESDDFVGSVSELSDGRILLFGTMTVGGLNGQKKMVLMKLNSNGKLTE